MLITYKTANNKNVCIVWGEVWTEPFTKKVGKKHLHQTTFYLKYDMNKINGRNTVSTVMISAWGKQSGQATRLIKHQEIVVFGLIQREEYQSEKHQKEIYKVTAQLIIPVTAVWDEVRRIMIENGNKYPEAAKYADFSDEGIPELDSYDEIM